MVHYGDLAATAGILTALAPPSCHCSVLGALPPQASQIGGDCILSEPGAERAQCYATLRNAVPHCAQYAQELFASLT